MFHTQQQHVFPALFTANIPLCVKSHSEQHDANEKETLVLVIFWLINCFGVLFAGGWRWEAKALEGKTYGVIHKQIASAPPAYCSWHDFALIPSLGTCSIFTGSLSTPLLSSRVLVKCMEWEPNEKGLCGLWLTLVNVFVPDFRSWLGVEKTPLCNRFDTVERDDKYHSLTNHAQKVCLRQEKILVGIIY